MNTYLYVYNKSIKRLSSLAFVFSKGAFLVGTNSNRISNWRQQCRFHCLYRYSQQCTALTIDNQQQQNVCAQLFAVCCMCLWGSVHEYVHN